MNFAPRLAPSGALLLLALALACAGDDGRMDSATMTAGTITVSTAGSVSVGETTTTAGETTTSGTTTTTTTTTGSTTGGGPCMASSECAADQVCAAGACVKGDGPCTSDSECTGDTYCCLDGCLPDGEEGGVCIPYGKGPKGDVNEACVGDVAIGLFQPSVQCEWSGPPPGDPFPDHVQVLTTPLIVDLANDSGAAAEILIVTYNYTDGGAESGWGSNPAYFGVIRVLNGQTCELLETIDDPQNRVIAASPPAVADITGDGVPEIVTHRAVSGSVAFTWDPQASAHKTLWVAAQSDISQATRWDGPSIHDLDDDGIGEVITGSEVYDGPTGVRLNPGQSVLGAGAGRINVLADVDHDQSVELIGGGVWRWDVGMGAWEMAYPGSPAGAHYAVADFGTPGATPADFDPQALDGEAEIAVVGDGAVELYTLGGQLILSAPGGGGPPTIGDFDNDGLPEIASAGGTSYSVFDLDCGDPNFPGCAATYVRWVTPSQDASSANTGSSIFDFEGDGAAEAIYADECFLRVYAGASGEVLYSAYRTSCTWFENPVVGDPDNDQNTELLVGSNSNCAVQCPTIDPIHRGVRCEEGTDCVSGLCDAGFCRCVDDLGCPADHTCTAPPDGTPGAGDTCRAAHPPGVGLTGVRVLRDSLDRWASSRPLWNQHAYSVTNIGDDMKVPATSSWPANFADPALNNFRQNIQGAAPAEYLPDITGKLDDVDACTIMGDTILLTSTVCNRGLKAVGAALPATFYLGDPADGVILCVAYTEEPVPVGECRDVSCLIDAEIDGVVTVVVNDDGMGGKVTVECDYLNNTDQIPIDCKPVG
ncbi:MAG: VCBS repeat-containing protein [Nannocystaceae bacterium]